MSTKTIKNIMIRIKVLKINLIHSLIHLNNITVT